ncbi:MAG: VIT1/CCC1 transporter family protein [Candidatus Omnitrophica bacterium]|nr:VIT1/CCC1 transporter family protein [Candidatus Omnitrophota bacterium]
MLNEKVKSRVLAFQKAEITEHFIYGKLASRTRDARNRKILDGISEEELKHFNIWKGYTETEVKPDRVKIWLYTFISAVFGITFAIKLMEKGEGRAEVSYREISEFIPEADSIAHEEEAHENELISLIDEERLRYAGSMVLGLNDALVELTGALAGYTLALQNVRLIAVTGLITGIAASLSMAASEYLSTKTESGGKNPVKASVYTGIAYILAVIILILPFFLFKNIYLCLGVTVFNAIILILIFSFYISVAKGLSFKKRFFEMAPLTLGISALTFGIGFLIKGFL